MVENIERVLQRGEKIELLVDKTENLNQQAFRFKRQSTVLRRTMWARVRARVRVRVRVTVTVRVRVRVS